jgi:polyisoprenoid-binding protein YceI
MTSWIFEPGHTEVEFRARHMMVTWVRGLFKDIHGRLDFDLDSPLDATFEGEIDATKIWTGEPARDAHLRSADFFDVENHPRITFNGQLLERTGDTHFKATADVTIRGNTRAVEFEAAYLGQWETPFWVRDENRGMMRRIGFEGRTKVNRHDFGVSWQDHLPGGGLLVSNEADLVLDLEAIHEGDLEKTGAIEYYRRAEVPATAQAGSPGVKPLPAAQSRRSSLAG